MTLVLAAVAVMVCLVAAPQAAADTIAWRQTGWRTFLPSVVAAPLFFLFGVAAFAVPVAGLLAGGIFLRRFDHARRARWILRLSLSIPLLAGLVAVLGRIAGSSTHLGGRVGSFYFRYLEKPLGTVAGLLFGTVLLVVFAGLLWGVRFRRRRDELQPEDAVKERRPNAGRARSRDAGETTPSRSRSTDHREGAAPEETSEASLRPLPAPGRDGPLCIGLLPDPPPGGGEVGALQAELPDLRRRVAEIVQRTTGVILTPGPNPPQIGMNAVVFEFAKQPCQSVPVRKAERAEADLGVETGRSPALVGIGDVVRIQLPLLPSERSFAPIKPLLGEAAAASGGAPSYLFGRAQDRQPFMVRLDEARHVLVAGTTGGGKTVLLHTLIFGFAFRYPPSAVRLALADHKVFEFSRYRRLPHLWQDVVTTPQGFARMVDNLDEELRRRKAIRRDRTDATFPALVVIVDEFAGYDSDKLIRLIAEARGLSMHFVLATQHPTAEVISTAIKANLVTRVSFKTTSRPASQLVLGVGGAAALLPRGDCLVGTPSGLHRVQAGWVTGQDDGESSDLAALQRHLAGGSA